MKIIRYWVKYFLTFFYFLCLSIKNKGTRYFVSVDSMGDTCFALSFSNYLNSKYHCKYIVSEKQHKMIVESYPHLLEDQLLFYKKGSILAICIYIIVHNKVLCDYFKKRNIYVMYPTTYKRLQVVVDKDFISIVCNENLKIPSIPLLTYPEYPRVNIHSIVNWHEIKDKVVVINPYSISMSFSDMEIWEKMADELIKRGYIPFTNVIKDQKEIKSTLPLKCSIYEMANIASEIPMMISLRSGIIDYLINTNCRKFVIYNRYSNSAVPPETWYNVYNLSQWKKSNVYQSNPKTSKELYSDFLRFIDNS